MDNRFNFTKAKLTAIPAAEPGKQKSYYDTKLSSLILLVTGNGVKTFYVYKKVQGRPERIKVGRFPDLSVENARNRAKVVLSEIAQDRNPATDKRKIRDTMTMGELFIMFEKKHGRLKKSWRNDVYIYDEYLSRWADTRISDIRKGDVKDLHSEIGKANGHPHQANRVRALLHTLYEFALDREYEGVNPCRGVKKFKERPRDRFLLKDEIPRFLDTVLNDPHPVIRDFILVALFTGARSGNIQAMRWEEIDWERKTWTIPDSKSGEGYTVPLVDQAVKILRNRRKKIASVWVYPSDVTRKHIGEPKRQWHRICKDAEIQKLRIHDLRRTLGSWMAQTGATGLLIDGALGHKIDTSSVTGVYARLDIEPIRKAMKEAVREILVNVET